MHLPPSAESFVLTWNHADMAKAFPPRSNARGTVIQMVPLAVLGLMALSGCDRDDPTGTGSGTLQVTVSGLSGGAQASVRVTGPGNYNRFISGSTTLSSLVPGEYTITADDVIPLEVFAPAPRIQTVSVGKDAASAIVTYAQITGSIAVNVSGLPPAGTPTITVKGPDGFQQQITSSRTLNALVPGQYSILSTAGTAGSCEFAAGSDSITVTVNAGSALSATVTYTAAASNGYNMCIEGAYLVQAVQHPSAAIALVGGREALVRVFVRGSEPRQAAPSVRVRFFEGGVPVHTVVIPAPGNVPVNPDEGSLSTTWNARVPGTVLRPGVTMRVELDPDEVVPENDRTDNVLPKDGTPMPLDVRWVVPARIRFVPVTQQTNGTTGSVHADNIGDFLRVSRRLMPLGLIDADLGSPLVTTGPAVQPQNANNAWQRILQELEAKRMLEAEPGQPPRHYVGVVQTGYNNGVAGLGYVPGWSVVVWDHLGSHLSASWVLAHELGHNWNRWHVLGCQNPSSVDTSYPYENGIIGVFGYDLDTDALVTPDRQDIMSYCTAQWISDYNYRAILQYRGVSSAEPAIAASSLAQDVMVVWGSVREGRVVLEPTFVTRGYPMLPSRGGSYRAEGLDGAGGRIFSFSFEPSEIADLPGEREQQFAFAVPLPAGARERLDGVRVAGVAGEVRRALRTAPPTARQVQAVVRRLPGNRVELRWDRTRHEAVLVRDPRTREVIAIARNGVVEMVTAASELDLIPSDAPRATSRRLTIPHIQ